MKTIKLIFRNDAQPGVQHDVVLFQRNSAASIDDDVVAWKLIPQCDEGATYPFDYQLEQQVGIIDAWGNHTPLLHANGGDVFSVSDERGMTGTLLKPVCERGHPHVVAVRNDLDVGAISVIVYKDGRPLFKKNRVEPGELALFELKPELYVGACAHIEEGEVMNARIASAMQTKLDLMGLSSADIVMTGGGGGGVGRPARPLVFSLENQTPL